MTMKEARCKDCKFYKKDCFGHSGYCQIKKEKNPGGNCLVGCNRKACNEYQKDKEVNQMKKVIGTCGKHERYIVYWFEGDSITIPALNVTIVTYTRDREEALAICKRNFLNFVEG